MDARTVIFYGPSGGGKGTQAKLLVSYLESKDPSRRSLYIETGARFRTFMEGSSFTSKEVKRALDAGELLPEFLPIWVWSDFLIENYSGSEHLILDGLARRVHEAPVLDGALEFYKRELPDVVILNVSRMWAFERLKARGRYDDTDRDINRRLDWYDAHVVPTVEYFRKNPRYRVHDVNGEQAIEKVHQDVVAALFS